MPNDECQTDAKPQGWWWPANSRKAHYMVGSRSLCGGWGAYGQLPPDVLSQDNDDSPDNCAACRKRLQAMRAKPQTSDLASAPEATA